MMCFDGTGEGKGGGEQDRLGRETALRRRKKLQNEGGKKKKRQRRETSIGAREHLKTEGNEATKVPRGLSTMRGGSGAPKRTEPLWKTKEGRGKNKKKPVKSCADGVF